MSAEATTTEESPTVEAPAETSPEQEAPAAEYNTSTPPRPEVAEPEASIKADPPRDEAERIDPQPVEKVLESGLHYDLQPLKLRQFLRLLRIITRGASDVMDGSNLDFADPDAFAQTFMSLVLFAIPEAEDETVDFIKSMVKPVGITGSLDKDSPKWDDLFMELDNPELDDVITIVQTIIEKEAEDLRALGKRLQKMFESAQKMGATTKNANVKA